MLFLMLPLSSQLTYKGPFGGDVPMNRRDFIRNTSLLASAAAIGDVGNVGWAAEQRCVSRRSHAESETEVPECGRRTHDRADPARRSATRSSPGCSRIASRTRSIRRSIFRRSTAGPTRMSSPATSTRCGSATARPRSGRICRLAKDDEPLRLLIAGTINRQTKNILKDPYANAFYKDASKLSDWRGDHTEMKPGVHERKWEVDSLCYPIRLAYGYWKATGDAAPFDQSWREAISLVLQTFREQQRKHGPGPYHFLRIGTSAERHAGRRRLWPADPARRTDPLDVPPQRRRHGVPVPGSVELLRRGRSAASGRDGRGDPPRRQDGRGVPRLGRRGRKGPARIRRGAPSESRHGLCVRGRWIRQLLLHRRRERAESALVALSWRRSSSTIRSTNRRGGWFSPSGTPISRRAKPAKEPAARTWGET